ncbi:MAG: lytic transglycosylase domain-containing protein [Candidatus Cloacimonetes bacterium]|nr:lytic transglycosylase domain-containing protein [Candidatus Cloacimonadota bacterium]
MNKKYIKFTFFLLILIIIIFNPISARFFTIITALSFRLDVENYYNVIERESSFRCFALSPKKAIGLGQVQGATAKYIQPHLPKIMLWFPPTNLYISGKYMRYLLKKYNNNWSLALAAYNWGETNVSKRIGKMKIVSEKNYKNMFKDISETYSYINKILDKK